MVFQKQEGISSLPSQPAHTAKKAQITQEINHPQRKTLSFDSPLA
jgi:hypothetical protein